MLVAELVLRKLQTEDETRELEDYMERLARMTADQSHIDKLYKQTVQHLFTLYDKLQNQRVVLKQCNISTGIKIEGNAVSVSDALEIAETLEKRLNLYTNMINGEETTLDIFTTMKQRSELLEEYFKLMSCIKSSDWSTTID